MKKPKASVPKPKTASVKAQPPLAMAKVEAVKPAIPPVPPKPFIARRTLGLERPEPAVIVPAKKPELPVYAHLRALADITEALERQRKDHGGDFAGAFEKGNGYQGEGNRLALDMAGTFEALAVRLRAIVVT